MANTANASLRLFRHKMASSKKPLISGGVFGYRITSTLEVLVIKEGRGWNLPGGKADFCAKCVAKLGVARDVARHCDNCNSIGWDAAEYAAIREFNEEMGLEPKYRLGYLEAYRRRRCRFEDHYAILFVQVPPDIDRHFRQNDEANQAKWIPVFDNHRPINQFGGTGYSDFLIKILSYPRVLLICASLLSKFAPYRQQISGTPTTEQSDWVVYQDQDGKSYVVYVRDLNLAPRIIETWRESMGASHLVLNRHLLWVD